MGEAGVKQQHAESAYGASPAPLPSKELMVAKQLASGIVTSRSLRL
jgi:hypothetical protein